jgi:type IV secretory pathway VirB4 component
MDRVLLEKTILETYRAVVGRAPRLSDLKAACEKAAEPELRKIATLLYPWTGDRPYGKLLDRDSGLATNKIVTAFDLKGLSQYPDLQSVMILILTDFILREVEADKSSFKRIILDEAWELLKSQAAANFMEYCARTLRKTGSGITFITQGLEEIVASPIGAAIINNTATKLVLLQRGDTKTLVNTLKLNPQELALIQSLRSKKGEYSEAFLIEGEERQVIRVYPHPMEYWLATSDAKDNVFLRELVETKNISLWEAVKEAAATHPWGVAMVADTSAPNIGSEKSKAAEDL